MQKGRLVRWYDKYPNIALLIDGSENLSEVMQHDIGESMLKLTREFCKVLHQSAVCKTLGADTVLSLYKSKRKLRWYDHIPAFHEATNLMLTMPKEALVQLDAKCSELVTYYQTVQEPLNSRPLNSSRR